MKRRSIPKLRKTERNWACGSCGAGKSLTYREMLDGKACARCDHKFNRNKR